MDATTGSPGDPAAQLRAALRQAAMPVTVVLVRDRLEVRGATVSSFMPVSMQPPSIAVGIGRERWLHEPLLEAEAFSVSILAAGQEPVARHFSSRPDRATGVHTVRYGSTPGGAPCIAGSLAVLECSPAGELGVGDHTLHVGEVLHASVDTEAEPLLWHAGDFAAVARPRT